VLRMKDEDRRIGVLVRATPKTNPPAIRIGPTSHRKFWNYRDEATVTDKDQAKRRRE